MIECFSNGDLLYFGGNSAGVCNEMTHKQRTVTTKLIMEGFRGETSSSEPHLGTYSQCGCFQHYAHCCSGFLYHLTGLIFSVILPFACSL